MSMDALPAAPDAEIGICGSLLLSPPTIGEAKLRQLSAVSQKAFKNAVFLLAES